MTDATRLALGLEDYAAALERHHARLRDEGAALETAWFRLRDVYEGHGAEVFAQAFERARQMIAAYADAAAAIQPLLRERLDALHRFDAPDAPPL